MMLTAKIHMGNSTSVVAFPGIGAPEDPRTALAAQCIDSLRYDLSFEFDPESPHAGTFHLITPTGIFASGLVPRVQRLLAKYMVPCEVLDTRKEPQDELPLWLADKQVTPRDYQLRFVERAFTLTRGVIDSAPRSGKTLSGILLIDRNPLPTLWIAPTKGIVKQTLAQIHRTLPGVKAIMLLGEGSKAEKVFARSRAAEQLVVVTTPQTALKLPQSFWQTRRMLIADEVHHAAGMQWQEINMLAEPVYYRFGMTGTHFRSDPASEVMMHSIISGVIGKITAEELVARGLLAPCDVLFVPIEAPRVRDFDLDVQYRFGITYHEYRNAIAAWAARQCVSAGRRTIMLIRLKAHGEKLAELLPEATYVNGEDSDATESAIAKFNDGKIPILIGTSVLGEGRDLPAADALIYAKGYKASVTVTQDVFRVLTGHVGKRNGVVVEFADRHASHLLRHSLARARLYAAQPTFNVRVLTAQDMNGFAQLVAR